MARGFITNASGKVLVWGSALAAVVVGLLFSAMDAPQCPEGYTQEQINASGCIVGANIGIGLLVVASPMIWAVCVYVAALALKPGSAKKKDN